jgi:hypothetical protein
MRYLRVPSPFHLRLGWLDVMVRLVGSSRRDLASVASSLPAAEKNFEKWIADAHLSQHPHGGLMPSKAGEIPRMLVSYGLYDKKLEALTDAGQVLLATPEAQRSPFLWEHARRWLGLWLLMGADGDVVLTILRLWPEAGLPPDSTDEHVGTCLVDLAAQAKDDEERKDLAEQAKRLRDTGNGHRMIAVPRLEPLRELGYLARVPASPGYALTQAGERMRDILKQRYAEADAETLLAKGLSRCFFAAEGVGDAQPAEFDVLVAGIEEAPEALVVTEGEVPLSPLVSWIQWSLLQRGQQIWIDDELAAKLARAHQTDVRGSFELKRDERVGRLNLAWKPRKDDERRNIAAVSPAPSQAQPGSEPTTTSDEPQRGDSLDFFLSHRSELPALLWLQYIASRATKLSPSDTDVLRRGGVTTRLRQLEALLRLPANHLKHRREHAKDGLPPTFLPATECLEHHIAATRTQDRPNRGHYNLERLLTEWSDIKGTDIDTILARVSASKNDVLRETERDRDAIEAFLNIDFRDPIEPRQINEVFNKDWPRVRELTRALTSDLLADGRWTLNTLRERVRWHVSNEVSPRLAAKKILATLFSASREYEYWEPRVASTEWIQFAKGSGIFNTEGEPTLTVHEESCDVRLSIPAIKASSQEHAIDLGRQRCDEAVAQATWITRRDDAPQRPSNGREDVCVEDGGDEPSDGVAEAALSTWNSRGI